MARGFLAAVATACVLVAYAGSAQAAIDDLTLISGALGGPAIKPDGQSAQPMISADERYVVFVSAATNLVAADGNGRRDVFRRDRLTGETVLVSRADGPGGAPGDDHSGTDVISSFDHLAVSADGRFVAFGSLADNLVGGADPGYENVFVRDVALGRTHLVSRTDADAASSGGDSGLGLDISADGSKVVFTTGAPNMPSATPALTQVVLRDLVAGTTTLVSRTAAGVAGDGRSDSPTISDDGRRVAFTSRAANFGVPPGKARVFIRDLAANTLDTASRFHGIAGEAQTSYRGEVSGDGKKVGWSDGHGDRFYVRDLATGATENAAVLTDGGRIPGFCCYSGRLSRTGLFVAIYAPEIAPVARVFHRDLITRTTTIVSRLAGPGGAEAHGTGDLGSAISATGRFVSFASNNENLSDADFEDPGPADGDVFLRDVLGPPPPPPPPPPADTQAPSLSGVSMTRRRFRVGRAATPLAAARRKALPRGTRFRFTLSEPARVQLRVARRLPGVRIRRNGKRVCVRASKRLVRRLGARRARRARCAFYKSAAIFTRARGSGRGTITFSGRVGKRALRRGRYRVLVSARDGAGNRTPRDVRLTFRIG